ncbi:MAG TPA: hypothetical protein VF602_02040 [Pedobacter sp.]|jgi:hypothetical protein
MYRYQFYISFNDKTHTASSKAIQDCGDILTQAGYENYTVVNTRPPNDKRYLLNVFKIIAALFFRAKPKSIIATQYPLLSGNNLFKYVVKALRLKKVKFFCIIHDLDELRYGTNHHAASKEVENLNCYDCIIVHNDKMQNWLIERGVSVPIVVLGVFDYLSLDKNQTPAAAPASLDPKSIAFAGNLSKSTFIYSLDKLKKWRFNLYGPNFSSEKAMLDSNIFWKGSFSPDDILSRMEGAFGLIWDGENINKLDSGDGNYLRYNNPHKLSLYLAAGLPVIAPRESAVSALIVEYNLGILVSDLNELEHIDVDNAQYQTFKKNVFSINRGIRRGEYFKTAIAKAEGILKGS